MLNGMAGEMSDDILAVLLCDKLGWTYDEFLDTPVWFIKGLLAKIEADTKHNERQAKKKK